MEDWNLGNYFYVFTVLKSVLEFDCHKQEENQLLMLVGIQFNRIIPLIQ